MSELNQLISQLKPRHYKGSTIAPKTLYHDIPLPGFDHLKSHRRNSLSRWNYIAPHLNWKGKSVVDLCCSNGALSLLAAKANPTARVIGYDQDQESLAIGRYAASELQLSNVQFNKQKIDLNFIKSLEPMNITLWLSAWMWQVQEYGLEVAKDMLFEISAKSIMLIFESAGGPGDGMAGIPGATQEIIGQWLLDCTAYAMVKDIGFVPGWGSERHIYICGGPVTQWQGYTARITRISRAVVRKQFKHGFEWMVGREVECLRRLQKYENFPRLIGSGKNYIDMSYCGERGGKITDRQQCMTILEALKNEKIRVRDINPKNLLVYQNKYRLIDYGWAIYDSEVDSPVAAPKCLGGRWYEAHNQTGVWDDEKAMEIILKEHSIL